MKVLLYLFLGFLLSSTPVLGGNSAGLICIGSACTDHDIRSLSGSMSVTGGQCSGSLCDNFPAFRGDGYSQQHFDHQRLPLQPRRYDDQEDYETNYPRYPVYQNQDDYQVPQPRSVDRQLANEVAYLDVVSHFVRPGETLSEIASAKNCSLNDLIHLGVALHGHSFNPNKLRVGQRIILCTNIESVIDPLRIKKIVFD